jgi:hypothetical protein
MHSNTLLSLETCKKLRVTVTFYIIFLCEIRATFKRNHSTKT